jgi:hypothetical protein
LKKVFKIILISALVFGIAKAGFISSEYLFNQDNTTLLADGLPYEH